jgi:hypothetical protein
LHSDLSNKGTSEGTEILSAQSEQWFVFLKLNENEVLVAEYMGTVQGKFQKDTI